MTHTIMFLVTAFLKLNARIHDDDGKLPPPFVVVIMTNSVEKLDPELVRDGRAGNLIKFAAPNADGRLGILNVHACKSNMIIPGPVLEYLVHGTDGFSSAQMMGLVNRMALAAYSNALAPVMTAVGDNRNPTKDEMDQCDYSSIDIAVTKDDADRALAMVKTNGIETD